MGFAIAKAAKRLGADVHLIAAHTDEAPPVGIKVERVESAQDMYDAVRRVFEHSDIVVKAAAVADYRPAEVATSKIKSEGRP